MNDVATTGAVIGLRPFEVVVRSTSLIANKEQGQQRYPPAAICQVHAVPTAASKLTKTISDKRVAVVDDRPDPRDPTTFELRIHCRQRVEQLTTTARPFVSGLIDSSSPITTPCRVKDNRVCVEQNHFINGTNMTPSVVQGLPVLTAFNVKDDQATPKWSFYGVSSIESVVASDMDLTSSNYNIWLKMQPNDLPPPAKYLNRRYLTHIILDFHWTTDSCSSLYDKLVQQQQLHAQVIGDTHNNITSKPSSAVQEQSLETLAIQTGLDKIFSILSRDRNQPLIFSPIRIRWFVGVMQDNKRTVDSLTAIYRNAICSRTRDSMDQSIQRMWCQFPSVLQANRHLLLQTALEAQTNMIVVAGPNLKRRLRSRRGAARSAVGGTGPRGRHDGISGCDTDPEMTDDMWAPNGMALPFIANDDHDCDYGKNSDNNNNDDDNDAHEPLPQQPQQRQLDGGTNERQLGNCLHNVPCGRKDGASAIEEPCLEQFVSHSFNMPSSNYNCDNRRSTDALVPDNSVQFITAMATSTPVAGEGSAQKFGVAFGGADQQPRHLDMNMYNNEDMSMSSFDDELPSMHASPLHQQQYQQLNSPPNMLPSDFSDFFHSSEEEQEFESFGRAHRSVEE